MRLSARSSKARKGTTLIENVMAVLIVSMIIIILINTFGMITKHIRIAHHRVVALNQAQSKIEQLKNQGYYGINWAAISGAGQAQNVIIDSYNLTTAADDLLGIMTTRAVSIVSGALTVGRKIIVTVTWTTGGSAANEVLETLIYQPD